MTLSYRAYRVRSAIRRLFDENTPVAVVFDRIEDIVHDELVEFKDGNRREFRREYQID